MNLLSMCIDSTRLRLSRWRVHFKPFFSFGHSESGATAIEYSLLGALIAVATIAGASQIEPGFDAVEGEISEALSLSDG